DKGTGKEQNITIQGSGGLDKAEVEKMAKDAETHAAEDKEKREAIEARNLLDSAVYQAEKLSKDNEDKLSDDDRKTLADAVEEAKKTLADEKADKDALEAATKELNDKLMPIGAKLYEAAAAEEKPVEDANTDDVKEDGPIEGEVVDDKEK
ncbi:MAG: Hsp70 family protein, partial [Candidatus Saccharimonadales bacterium]